MSYTWNDPIAPGFDWSDVGFLNMLIEEINKRDQIVSAAPQAIAPVVAGDDVQSASFWFAIQEKISLLIPLFSALPAAYLIRTRRIDEVGTVTEFFNIKWTMADVRQAAGLPPSPGFRRRRYRQIGSLTATVDTEGNPAQIGQLAIVENQWPVWRYNGVRWVAASSSEEPDVLDSSFESPFLCRGEFINQGDLLGYVFFDEIVKILNLLVATSRVCIGGPDLAVNSRDGAALDGNFERAKSLALERFGNQSAGAGFAFAGSSTYRTAGLYTYQVTRGWGNWRCVDPCFPRVLDLPRTTDYYVLAGLIDAMGSESFVNSTFDANGDPVAFEQAVLLKSEGVQTTAASEVSLDGGNPTQLPKLVGPSVAGQAIGYRGQMWAFQRWDVPGGLRSAEQS